MRKKYLLIIQLLLFGQLYSQIKITSQRVIAEKDSIEFGYPIFSKDGKQIYFTTLDYKDIWQSTTEIINPRKVVEGELIGYGFSVSDNGNLIAYRKTTWNGNSRIQENFVKDISKNNTSLISFGEELQLPKFELLPTKSKTEFGISQKSASIILTGIVDEKIQIIANGKSKIIDPIKNGKYIWPKLSPDNKFLVAYELSEGLIIFDLNGKLISKLGYFDAPSWTKDGKWIICHKEKDENDSIISSDLFAISVNGKKVIQLTNTDQIELYPETSFTVNEIVCHTKNGKIILFNFGFSE